MMDPTIAAATPDIGLAVLVLIDILFFSGFLIIAFLRRPARLLAYRLFPLPLYVIFRSSLGFFLIFLTFGSAGLLSFRHFEEFFPIEKFRMLILAAAAIFILAHIIFLVYSVFHGGVFRISNVINMYQRNFSAAMKATLRAITIFAIPIILYLAFFYTNWGIGISYAFFRYAFLIVGFVIIPAIFFLQEYYIKRSLRRYLFYGKPPRLMKFDKYRFCYIINGKNKPGMFSDIMNTSSVGGLVQMVKPGPRRLDVPQIPDYTDRVKAYSDYFEEIHPYQQDEEAPGDAEQNKRELEWVVRSMGRPMLAFMNPILFLLDSADYRSDPDKQQGRRDWNETFARQLHGVYLLVDKKTSQKDIRLFHKMLDAKNTLSGGILVSDAKTYESLENDIGNISGVEVVEISPKGKKSIITSISSNEIIRIQSMLGRSTAVEELAELEAARARMDEGTEAFQRGEIEESEQDKRTEEIIEAHQAALYGRLNYIGSTNSDEWFPDSVSYCRFRPAMSLIRNLVRENDHSTRIYIMFNLLEMMAKTMVFAWLSLLPPDHPDVQGFPNSITGQGGSRGSIVDFADDAHHLHRFAFQDPEPIGGLPEAFSPLRDGLLMPHQITFNEEMDRMRIFFPFIVEEKVSNLAELLPVISFMRNQIRGHGVVTNFLSIISYPLILKYLDITCSAINRMGLNAHKAGNGEVRLQLSDHVSSGLGFLRFEESLADYIFLEGYRKQKPHYIAYSAGSKYRPVVVTDLQ